MPSFTLIHPTVWPQYTNVTNRHDRQQSDSIGRTVLKHSPKKAHDSGHTHFEKTVTCRLILATVNLCNKYEVLRFTLSKVRKMDLKFTKWGGIQVVRGDIR